MKKRGFSEIVQGLFGLMFLVFAVPELVWSQSVDKWNKILDEARKEKEVVVYSGAGPKIQSEIGKAMAAKYGINVQFITGQSSEIVKKIKSERKAGLYLADGIMVGGGSMVKDVRPSGALTPLEPFLVLPEVKDPQAWPDGKFPFYDKKEMSVRLTQAYWSFILVNSDLVPEGSIKSYYDLLQPRWKGKMVLLDPGHGGVGRSMCAFLLAYIVGYEKGEKFLGDLVRQEPAVVKDDRMLVEWVARGKYPIGLAASMSVVPQFQSAGSPIKWVRASEGGYVSSASTIFAVTDKAPHPNAVTVLLNWLLTAEGQTVCSKAYGQPPLRVGVKVPGIDPFTFVMPKEKVFYADEDFYTEHWVKAMPIIKRVFK